MIPRQIIEQGKERNDNAEKNNIEKDIISYRLQSAIGKERKGDYTIWRK